MALLPHCAASNRGRRGSCQGATYLPPASSLLLALLVIWTRKQWRRWPSHAHKVTVARLEATTNAAPAALDIFSVSRAGARQGKGTESGRWERAPCPRLVRAPSLAPVVRGLRAVDNASRRVRRAPPANPVKLDQEQQVWSRVEEKTSQNPYTTQPKVLDTGIQQRTKQPSDFVESRFA